MRANDIAQTHRTGPESSELFLPDLPLPFNLPVCSIAIADMADAFGVTHRTLHFYEEKRLLIATRLGPMRMYDLSHARRMAVINACREVDMPIAVIQDLMNELALAATQREAETIFDTALHARKRELAAQQSNLRRQMQKIEELLDGNHRDDGAEKTEHSAVHLSPIELKCLMLMAEGSQASRIAAKMDMDISAVLTLEAGIVRKFNAVNRFQAVAKAILTGVISQD